MKEKYFDSNTFRSNLNEYEEAIKKNEPIILEADELTEIAEYYQYIGDNEKALEVCDHAMSLYPGVSEPLLFRSRYALLVNEDSSEAKQYAMQISDKTDLDYYYLIAEIMIVDNHIKSAEKYLEEKMADVDITDDYCIDVANLFLDYELYAHAEKWLKRSKDKNSEEYKEIEAQIELNNGNFKESERIYNQLLDKDPYSTPHWNKLATAQFLSNEISDSITSSEFSIAIDPTDVEAYLNKANGLYSLHNYEDALLYYKKVAELAPEEETGNMFQGFAFTALGRNEEAISHLKKALAIADDDSPNIIEIYKQMAYNYGILGDLPSANEYIEKALALEPENKELLILKGHVALMEDNKDESQKLFQEALNVSSSTDESVETMYHIALAYYDNGYVKAAYKLCATLIDKLNKEKIKPAVWGDLWAYVALCSLRLHDKEHSEMFLNTAIGIDKDKLKAILGEYFPDGLDPKDYYKYYLDNINKF